MKTKNENPVKVYSDPDYESKVKQDLSTSQTALQTLLNIWNTLDLTPLTEINELVLNPEKVYSDAVRTLAVVPVTSGRFQVSKEAYISTLDIPVPDSLYRAAKSCREISFCAVRGLWNIEDNQVVLNQGEAYNFINAKTITISDPKKIEFAKLLSTFIESANSLNKALDGEIFTGRFYQENASKFAFKMVSENSPLHGLNIDRWQIAINPDQLLTWLNRIKS